MSRGFVKEDDQEEAPFIPPRAALPPGVINYVTPAGYEQLQAERKQLENQLSNLNIEDEKEKRHTRAVLTGKLNLLNERLNSARVLDPAEQPLDEVRFGATVTFEVIAGEQIGTVNRFQLVGVDEADIKLHKIAFVAPLARALTGKKMGEVAEFKRGPAVQEFRITKIEYDLTSEN
ncbi:transcription elongation factor GreA [Antarcticibacterium flavum]|uniref:Transcription elongation factor GreA n=1 Tax=Antarcticibacterium flavum TaxID=2058175 RepID=A0A5B7WYP9_9FLAO|nr:MULTISPECIES: GreA/GreB family elongation factor [Antarcticibacterium]MCM4158936.1 transcription elongation factor GreA [Antarcticibacterium sp. W02-3]QCY68190.1 transcription elongation factor GreA [Antarcticibacterium flavum]